MECPASLQKTMQNQGLELEATNAGLRAFGNLLLPTWSSWFHAKSIVSNVLHRCSRNYAIDSHVGIKLTKASNFWNRTWTMMHPAIYSVVPSLLRARVSALNLSDSSRSVETEPLCTAFSPRISVMCAWKPRRRLSTQYCGKSKAIA